MQPRNPNNALGIDVSHWQGNIDWDKVAESGISFAYLKATEGIQFIDDRFAEYVEGARSVGILVGVYHFLRASTREQAIAEAQSFISAINDVGGIELFDLPLALDVEDRDNTPEAARAWIEKVTDAFGRPPILYTYPSFIDVHLGDSLCDIPLWYANYGNDQPDDRGGWSEWMFLQFSETGYVPGIDGHVDLDEFNGTVEELRKLGQPLLCPEDANKVISLLSGAYGSTDDQEARVEFHRLANELRKASGQPEE